VGAWLNDHGGAIAAALQVLHYISISPTNVLMWRRRCAFHVRASQAEASEPSRLRWPPRCRVFGSLATDAELLAFLADDAATRLFRGLAVCQNRRLTGADNRHAPTLSAFGAAVGQAYGATSFACSGTSGSAAPAYGAAAVDGDGRSSSGHSTTDAFAALAPPLLLLALGRCSW
jgi:hypothetical protein